MTKYQKQRPNRRPSHPGEVLKELWLDELGYSQTEFCDMLVKAAKGSIKKTTMQTKLNEIIHGKRAMSADFAVLVSRVLKTAPRMWMNLQVNLDIWEVEQEAA